MSNKTPPSTAHAPQHPETVNPTSAGACKAPTEGEEQFAGMPQLPTWRTMGLTPTAQRFCLEYLIDLNASKAYHRANPGVLSSTARSESSKYLANPNICAEIQRLMDERAIRTGITADRVVTHLWQIGSADQRELCALRVGACRHCWGLDNRYQRTAAEFHRDTVAHEKHELRRETLEKEGFEPRQFDEQGGVGFNGNQAPNPACPECFGDGEARPILKDSASFSEGAALLYAGLKQTKEGKLEVKTNSQMEALQLVGRHLQMFTNKERPMDEANPLVALMQQIAGNGTAAALCVVAQDPELTQRDLHTSAPGADLAPTVVLPKAPKAEPKPFKIPQSFNWKKK